MDDVTPAANFPKQAVVVIHGMGEQMPMDTIKGFVRAVWETDGDVTRNGMPQPEKVWSKPDARTGSLELRRITTRQSRASRVFPDGARADFYELYWADLSGGSTLDDVESWIFGLLLRNPRTQVPRSVMSAWLLLWVVAIGVVYLAVAALLPDDIFLWRHLPFSWVAGWPKWLRGAVAAILAVFAHRLLVPYFGRVVRYTRAKPDNVAAREAIRRRGLELLNALHDQNYDRIIVVGHSLGTILAYDLIAHFWASRLASHTIRQGDPAFAALKEVEAAVRDAASGDADAVERFHDARRILAEHLRTRPKPTDGAADTRWIITDLITLGSPLTHAEFLLASSKADLAERKETREFPVAPPVREVLDDKMIAAAAAAGMPVDPAAPALMSFEFAQDHWQLHHAAAFAVVKWTNIHDPSRFVACGDMISGPLRPVFGPGIIDVNLAGLRGQSWSFTHTKYWDMPSGGASKAPLEALRGALDLAGDKLGHAYSSGTSSKGGAG